MSGEKQAVLERAERQYSALSMVCQCLGRRCVVHRMILTYTIIRDEEGDCRLKRLILRSCKGDERCSKQRYVEVEHYSKQAPENE